MLPYEGYGVSLIILAGMTAPILCVGIFYYLKKRLEHKQIMMAIDKGVPLSTILPPPAGPASPVWVKHVSLGVATLVVALGFLVAPRMSDQNNEIVVIGFAIGGFGVYWVVRGLLNRRYASRLMARRPGATLESGLTPETSSCSSSEPEGHA